MRLSEPARRRAKVWFHRSRAVLWALIGAVSFLLGWQNSVVLVWVASVYANVVSDWGAAEAADDRKVLQRLDQLAAEVDDTRRLVLLVLAHMPRTESGPGSQTPGP